MYLGGHFLSTTCCLPQWNWRPCWLVNPLRENLPRTTPTALWRKRETSASASCFHLLSHCTSMAVHQHLYAWLLWHSTSASFFLTFGHLALHLQLSRGQADPVPHKLSTAATFLASLTSMQCNWQNSRYGPLMCVKPLCACIKKGAGEDTFGLKS